MNRDSCSEVFAQLRQNGVVTCLNDAARENRIYDLTASGLRIQRRLTSKEPRSPATLPRPTCDWDLYGRLCHRHRSAIILALTEILQPAAIKRRARLLVPGLRMSANNVRDAIRLLRAWSVVRPVRLRRRAHLHYELTAQGRTYQALLRQAGGRL